MCPSTHQSGTRHWTDGSLNQHLLPRTNEERAWLMLLVLPVLLTFSCPHLSPSSGGWHGFWHTVRMALGEMDGLPRLPLLPRLGVRQRGCSPCGGVQMQGKRTSTAVFPPPARCLAIYLGHQGGQANSLDLSCSFSSPLSAAFGLGLVLHHGRRLWHSLSG
jgi:hypothetical protein